MSECRPRALWWNRQMDDGHELLCCHLFLLQLISIPTKKAMDLKIHSLESRKKSTTVTRQQTKFRDFFQNYCISVTSISADWKLRVKLVISCQTSGAAMCMIFSILQSFVSGSRIFFFAVSGTGIFQARSNPDELRIISCSKRLIKLIRLEFH